MMAPELSNGWEQWSRHVLVELNRLNNNYERLNEKIDQVCLDVATVKVKAGVWGAIAGIIPAALVAFYLMLKGTWK